MPKNVNQTFFKTAGGINNDSGNSLDINCKRIFVTGSLAGPTAADFRGNIINTYNQTSNQTDIFVAGLDHCGKQKFFLHSGGAQGQSQGSYIVSTCDDSFLTGQVFGATAIDFAGNQITVNGGSEGIFVAGVDNCGHQKFYVTAGNNNLGNGGTQIVTDDHRLFITGIVNGGSINDFKNVPHTLSGRFDIFVAGLDKRGHQKFFVTAGGSSFDAGASIAVTEKTLFITGFIGSPSSDFNKTVITTYGLFDAFVAGLDKCGNQKFFVHAGGVGFGSIGASIDTDCQNAYVTGIIGGTATDFAGNSIPTTLAGIQSIFVAGLNPEGHQKFFVTADIFNTNNLSNDITVNDQGVFITGQLGGNSGTDFNGCSFNLHGGSDIFVAGLTKCGKQKFFKTAGGQFGDRGNSITSDDEGIFVTGFISGQTATDFCGHLINLQGGNDIFVAKLNFCGHQQFFRTAGSSSDDQGNQVVVRDNKVYLTGVVSGLTGTDFRGCPIKHLHGSTDIFVACLDDLCGEYRSKRTTMTNFPRRRRA